MKTEISICWLRRDLRLHDQAALYHALRSDYPVLLVFIFDPEILSKLQDKDDRRVQFIHQQLKKIDSELSTHGSSIYVLHEQVLNAFSTLNAQFEIKEVYANHDYEPYAIARDEKVDSLFQNLNIPFKTFKDQVIFEKSEIMKADGTPYTVFTPYSRRWKDRLSEIFVELPKIKSCINSFFRRYGL